MLLANKGAKTASLRLLSLLFTLVLPACALDPSKSLTQYGLTSWAAGQELTFSSINDLQQGNDGYLWLATNNGLVRFNGSQFKTYSKANSTIAGNSVTSLWKGPGGPLWVGLSHDGLCRFNEGSFSCFGKDQGVPPGDVRTIVGDGEGGIWFGVVGQGLGRYQNGIVTMLTTANGLPNPNITQLLRTRSGALWFGTYDGGAFIYKAGKFRALTKPVLPSELVWDLAEDKTGAIWVGTFSGLVRFSSEDDLHPQKFTDGLPSENVSRIYCSREGQVWVASNGAGLSRLEGSRFSTLGTQDGLSDLSVLSLTEDSEGDLWIGTKSGIYQLRDQLFSTLNTGQGLSKDFVRVVLENHQGEILAGNLNGGVNIVSFNQSNVAVRHTAPNCSPLAAYEDRQNTLWLGCAGGKIEHLRNDLVAEEYSLKVEGRFVEVNAFAEFHPGELLAATFGVGVARYQNGKWVVKALLPEVQNVSALLLSDDGLWVAAMEKGLLLLKADGARLDFASQMQGVRPIRFAKDTDGSIWIITDHGLMHADQETVRAVRFVGTPLQDCDLYSLIDDGRGFYWITSNRGVFRLPRDQLRAILNGQPANHEIELFSYSAGVKAANDVGLAQPISWRAHDGRLWFATSKGLLTVDPSRVQKNRAIPPVRIENILADDKLVSLNDRSGVSIAPDKHRIEIQYAALSLQVPEKVHFFYQLLGYDRGWIDAHGRRSAFYTDLPPDEYRFRVKASNNDGVWNEVGADLVLVKQPFYYQTAWFRTLCLVAAVAISLLAYQTHLRSVRRELIRVQTAVLRERETAARQRTDELTRINSSLRENLVLISEETDLDKMMNGLLSSAIEQLGALSACIFIHDESTDTLQRRFTAVASRFTTADETGDAFAECEQTVRTSEAPVWQQLRLSRQMILMDCRLAIDADLLWPQALMWHHKRQQPIAVALPMFQSSRLLGMLGVNFGPDTTKATFGEDQRSVAESVASLASMAVETHRLTVLARDAAISEERTRLSEEMHDGIQQLFAAISFQLAGAATLLRKAAPVSKLISQIERTAEIAEEGIKEVRRSINALRDVTPLTGQEFLAALRTICESNDSETVRCLFEATFEIELPTSRALNELRRIAQEAVTNAYKHSGASEVRIHVGVASNELNLTICDNGTGFEMSGIGDRGLGMRTMRERAKRAGADLQLFSHHSGTQIRVQLPLSRLL